MRRLRKIATLAMIFALLYVLRTAWSESSKLGLTSSPLMQASAYSTSGGRSRVSGNHLTLDLEPQKNKKVVQELLQTKADVEDQKLDESLDLLRNSTYGKAIAAYVDKSHVKITFGQPETPGAAAVFVPSFLGSGGRIIVSERMRDEEPSVIAAILAHEGTHAKTDSIIDYDSVTQEYDCYMVQAKVWEETRSTMNITAGGFETQVSELNPENDYAVEIMKMDKGKAFKQIWKDYKQIGIDLPLK